MKLKIIIAAPVILALLCAGVIYLSHKREMNRRDACLSSLRSTGWALAVYRDHYEGFLPPDFSLMSESQILTSPWISVCPKDKKPGDMKDITKWMDYIYIPWPRTDGEYAKYPLMYDRRLSNHNGKGICVVLVEQAVCPACPDFPETYKGQFFWDEGAKWLQKFAKEHPDLKIPMPEDLK
jgi:hypothetical protein